MHDDVVVFDCEIVRTVPGQGWERLPDVEYCAGWHDFAGMGISVVAAIDFGEHARPRLFLEDNKDDLAELFARRRWVVGWNSQKFDEPLLTACWGVEVEPERSYDLRAEVLKAAGILEAPGRHASGYSLDACARANLGWRNGKTGDGAMAPVLWQHGQYGQVADYCLNDVFLLARLLVEADMRRHSPSWHGARGNFWDPVSGPQGRLLDVTLPWEKENDG